MKKLLSSLLTIMSIASTSTSVISCNIKQAKIETYQDDLKIGKDVDISNAIDDHFDVKNDLGITNYYVIGDSLSDHGGIEKLIKDKFDINIKLGDLTDEDGKPNEITKGLGYNDAFTNGLPAAVILNDKLNFSEMLSSNEFASPYSETNTYGRNYSVGGATASVVNGATGVLLNDVTIDKQARSLISQHKIGKKDVVLMDIGGNDLFTAAGFLNDPSEISKVMNSAMDNIKKAFFTLLNNGIYKIIFMEGPDVSLVPRYSKLEDEKKKAISEISSEFHFKDKALIKLAQSYYKNSIVEYSLYDQMGTFENSKGDLRTWFENYVKTTYSKEANLKDAFNCMGLDGMKITGDVKNGFKLATKPKKLDEYTTHQKALDDFNTYFFFDEVHPTKIVHEHVGELFLKLLKENS